MSVAWKLAWRYLSGHKLRTTLTTLSIVLGVMIIFGLNSMIPAMERIVARQMMAAVSEVELSVRSVSGSPFDSQSLAVVQSAKGVQSATGILSQLVAIPEGLVRPAVDEYQVVKTVIVIGVDPDTVTAVRAFSISSGRFLESGDTTAVVLPVSLSQKLDLQPGDVWTLPSANGTVDLTVVGIFKPSMPALGTEEIYVPLAQVQSMLNLPDQISVVEAVLDANADKAAVNSAIQSELGSTFTLIAPDGDSEFSSAVQVGQAAFLLFGILSLAMGGFVIFNTFRTVVAERRRDIGLLRAVGASRRTIVLAILTETLLQGLMGSALGLLLGYLFALVLMMIVAPLAQKFLYMDMGAPIITLGNFLVALGLGLGITVLAGLIPALSASKTPPIEALRLESVGQVARKVRTRAIIGFVMIALAVIALITGSFNLAALGAVLFLAGVILAAPVLVRPLAETFGRLLNIFFAREGHLAQRNLARQPERAAVTALAMLIGLSIVVALAGVLSSTFGGFLSYLDRSLGADYLVMPTSLMLGGGNMGAAPGLAAELSQVEGVAGVTTLRLAYGKVDGTDLQVIGIDPQTYPVIAGLEFSRGEPAEAYAALDQERAIIVNGIFAATTGVQIDDLVTIMTPSGEQQYRIVGVGLDYLNAKLTTGYISQANLERDFLTTTDVLLMANAVDGADKSTVGARLTNLISAYPAFTLLESDTFYQAQVNIFKAALAMMYVMMAAMALPALIAMMNTLAINVIQRTREIGVLRAVGSTRKQIRRMILAESLLLALFGTGLGILAGVWLSYVLVGAMNFSGFVMQFNFPWGGVLAGLAVGLIFGVLAATLPARQAARLDIIHALRFE